MSDDTVYAMRLAMLTKVLEEVRAERDALKLEVDNLKIDHHATCNLCAAEEQVYTNEIRSLQERNDELAQYIADRKKDMRPEYDFASMEGGVRGKYAEEITALRAENARLKGELERLRKL